MPPTNEAPVFQWTTMNVRLAVSCLLGIAAYLGGFALEPDLRVLVSYNLAIFAYLATLAVRMTYSDGEKTRELAEKKDVSHGTILAVAATLSACSLAGVGFMLHRSQNWTPTVAGVHLILSMLAVFQSWMLLHTVFAVHYVSLYYDRSADGSPAPWAKGLEFPDGDTPDFWDFMYYSFTIAVCYQVSDVTIRNRHLRRVTLAHVLLSFLNVTLILGLVVEIVSTLVSSAGRG